MHCLLVSVYSSDAFKLPLLTAPTLAGKLADSAVAEDLPFKCPHCPRRFTRELYLKGHLVRHSDFKPYQCPHCKKAFGREHHLTSHMTHSHAASERGREGEGGEAIVFKCTLCGEGYPKVSQLTTHIQMAHADEASPQAPPTDPTLGEGPATEGVYSSSSSDEEAVLLIREDDDAAVRGSRQEGGKPQTGPVFHCPHCPRTFSREMYLASHLFSHSEDRPHKCLVCGKGFSRVHHLKSHMTHRHPQVGGTSATSASTSPPSSVEAAFKCPCCQRSFRKDFHLKSHIYQKHRDNKDAFEFLKQFMSRKRKSSSDLGVDMSPASMETEDKSPLGSKPMAHGSIAQPLTSEGSHFDFDKAQSMTNGQFKDLHTEDPLKIGPLDSPNPTTADLSPVFEEKVVPSGIPGSKAASQPSVRENDEKPHKCPQCGQRFARRSFLGSHIYQKHKRVRASSTGSDHGGQSASTGTAPKTRMLTGKASPSKENPTLSTPHVKEVSGRSRRVSSSTTISSDASDEDASHEVLHSSPANPSGVFKCPHCHRRFTRKAHLVSHVVAHSNERPYKCPHCEKAYGTGYHLKSHITYCHRSAMDTPPATGDRVVPSGDRAFSSGNRVFPSGDTVIPSGDTVFPFRCGECNESFPEHSMLRKHFSQSHSNSEVKETNSESVPNDLIESTASSLFSIPIGGSDGPPAPPPPPLPPPPPPLPNGLGALDSSTAVPYVEGGACGALMDKEGITTVVASGKIAPLPVEHEASPNSTVGKQVCSFANVRAYVRACVRVE